MTKVAILWHMHQPYYGDARTGEQLLPWVRLHALKDYFGMVELLREFPAIRLTFNLVPSLLVQLDAIARGTMGDRYRDLGLKPASALTAEEREFIVANFFLAHRPRMIDPYPRYRELFAIREEAGGGTEGASWHHAAARFSQTDLLDLQVWQKLAWIDPFYRSDPRIRRLEARGRDYREEDKLLLAEVEAEILRRVIPGYREAAGRGQVELSTSPFYHPILPLLCDSEIYGHVRPDAPRLSPPFQHPEDAAAQMRMAVECHEQFFGSAPAGFWPPEGAVSEAVVPVGASAGFSWFATDEVLLGRSLGVSFVRDGFGHVEQPELLYRPYRVRVQGAEMACLFRDHMLSDLVGFTYAGWPSQGAAEDLVNRIAEAGRRYAARSGGGEAVVAIILDGENAWEYYEGGGRPFLRTFYELLASRPDLTTVTMSEAVRTAPGLLDRLAPGSWASGDLYIWIGHQDDRRAWMQLADAHRAFEEAGPRADAAARSRAQKALFIAEGSDWFWWYGDDHSSDQDLEFDTLFRSYVETVYTSLGSPAPESLQFTNITAGLKTVEIVQPAGPIEPAVDGRGDEAQWSLAGYPTFRQLAGAMRRSEPSHENQVTAVRFGFGATEMFIRVDASARMEDVLEPGTALTVSFLAPASLRLAIRRNETLVAEWAERGASGSWNSRPDWPSRVAANEVLEIGMPLDVLRRHEDRTPTLRFFVTLTRRGVEVARYPSQVAVSTELPRRRQ